MCVPKPVEGGELFAEKPRLRLNRRGWLAARDAHHTKDGHLCERAARNENAQRRSMEIGRSNLYAAVEQRKQIIRHHTLDRLLVAELQKHPQPVELRAGKKSLPLRLEIVGKFAHKINAANLFHGKTSLLAFGREQLKCFRFAEFAGVQVAAQDFAIEESHDDFLVR